MDDNSKDRLTLAQRFLEPSNSTHRQYEALRAFFVDGVPSAEAATRFGYTPGSFRIRWGAIAPVPAIMRPLRPFSSL